MYITAKQLERCALHAPEGMVGRIKDVYFDDSRWRVRYLIVDTGSWLTGRSVLIAPAAITKKDWAAQRLDVMLTREQVRNSPDIDTAKPVSRQREEELHRYYAWPYYWTAPMMGAAYVGPITPGASPTAAAIRAAHAPQEPDFGEEQAGQRPVSRQKKEGDPHLRSAHEVRGYHFAATDKAIGHVEDFILEDENWDVRYLIVDTRNWWPGRKVLFSLPLLREISWMDRNAYVDADSETVRRAPEFDSSREFRADDAARLDEYYRSVSPSARTQPGT